MGERLLIIDSHALIHRAYHALPPLVSPEGKLINGVYGFLLVFFKILDELKPDYLIATFDLPVPTIRHKVFKEYKAKRAKAPENFYQQIEILKEILKTWPILCLEKEGYEADDIIATIVEKLKDQKNLEIIILTGDLDTLQLVKDNVKVYTFRKGIQDKIIYDIKKIKERFDLLPEQLKDYKALKGDPSDNILGVPKVGEKLAQKLLKEYQNLDGIYRAIESNKKLNIPPSILENLKKYKDQAYFSLELVTVIKDLDIEFDLEKSRYQKPAPALIPLFRKLGFSSFLKRLFIFKEELLKSQEKLKINLVNIEDHKKLTPLIPLIEKTKALGLLLKYQGYNYLSRQIDGLKVIFEEDRNNIYFIKKPILGDFFKKIKEIFSLKQKKEIYLFERKVILEEYPDFQILENSCWDLDILSWLIDSERKNYQILDLVKFFLKKNLSSENEAFFYIFDLFQCLYSKIEVFNLNYLYQEIEKPLVEILKDMEINGIFLNKEKISEILGLASKQKESLEKQIYQLAGIQFNLNSPLKLQEVLFNRLKIKTNGLKKTRGGRISTDFDSLKKIEKFHPIISLIISFRQLEKLINTFLIPLPSFISPLTSKIHPLWNQTGTSTGRLSCSFPNLQNIPFKGDLALMIRSAFEAENENVFLSLDYSQIELRLSAHLSSDPFLTQAFKENKDIHKITASYLFKVKEEEVTEEMRNKAKMLNYGILYGLGDKNLANYANISLEEAKKIKEEYFRNFFGLKNFLDYSLEKAKKLGYAETLFGRKRFLPLLGAYNRQGKEQERAAINMPIQGLAADLIKKTMIEIDKYLKENNLKSKIKLILQIHDELIFEGKQEIINKEKGKLIKIAENIYPLKVPLKVEAKIGKTLKDI